MSYKQADDTHTLNTRQTKSLKTKCEIRHSLMNAEVKKFRDPSTGYNDMRWVVVILVATSGDEDNLSRCSRMQSQNLKTF